ncbi:hypothetical protein [Saccharopolyspora phatthalungensis]|uniref:Uncharacterized protein n=1 Tax=Saccharopolyspora phatthalungensis TaxID=664693 RepID=A0A840Q6S2_9PSEU|nr:hypothetical protein [Saccharopolyspora phatthalungensis]MBB5156166.1 hypothetical protein [Saccharopolyspora phatthalungensis]
MVLTFVAMEPSLVYFRSAHDVSTALRHRLGPMIVDVQVARNALITANEAAVAAFASGGAPLTGPGQEYYNQMAIASQSLAHAAEVNAVGQPGTESLQTVESLLASYSDSISQAGAYFRADDHLMGTVALWNAWRQLHDPHGGIVEKLGELRGLQADALHRQVGEGEVTEAETAAWLAWMAGLCAFLVAGHVFIVWRFRRLLGGVLFAAIAVVVLSVFIGDVVDETDADIAGFNSALRQVLTEPDGEMVAHRTLLAMADAHCRTGTGECGPTMPDRSARAGVGVADRPTDRSVNVRLTPKASGAWLETGIPWLSVLIAGLVVTGFWPRLDEYSYGKR